MDVLLVLVPIFKSLSAVELYLLRYRYPHDPTINSSLSLGLLETVNIGGVEAFTGGKPLVLPIHSDLLLNELDRKCRQPSENIIFLIEDSVPPQSSYLSAMATLHSMGYRFAMTTSTELSPSVLNLADYLFLDSNIMNSTDRRVNILRYKRMNPHMEIIATELETAQECTRLVTEKADLLEGTFYYRPAPSGNAKLAPLKVNMIHMLNSVRDSNFEFSAIASIVQRDPALSVSLMRFINSPYIGVRNKIKTIYHAVTILGQNEVRKWVTASLFRSLAAERPSELVRLSLIRAKFAESLAPFFQLDEDAQSLFLMGMFSLLDVILETSMADALDSVNVSDNIRLALLGEDSPFLPVLALITEYELANWDSVMRMCAEEISVSPDAISTAYLDTIAWYHDLISENMRPVNRR